MKLRLISVFLVVVATLSAQTVPRAARVFIVSFDGGKPAVIADSEMPVLKKMVSEGAHTWEARTVVPSITLLSHASMISGVGPAILTAVRKGRKDQVARAMEEALRGAGIAERALHLPMDVAGATWEKLPET